MRKTKKSKNKRIVMVDERKKKNTGYSKKKSKAKTAQDTIPFDEIYENGLFRSEETFTIIFQLENLDYKVMRENEKDSFYEKYMHFLNTLPQDVQYQELVMNYPTDRKMLEEAIIPKQGNKICSRAVHRDYCQVMEGIIDTAANQSCEQVILAAMSYKPQTKLNDVGILFKYFKALQDEALNFGVKVSQLMPEESLEKLHRLYHMADKEPFLLPTNFLQCDVQLKDYIAPASFKFRSKYIEVGSCYSSVMFVKRFSYECDDEFITDLLDNTYNIAVSKHMYRMDKTESMKIMKRQMNDLEARMEKRRELNAKRGGKYVPYSLRQREKALEEMQEKLGSSNCDLFAFGLYIYVAAETLEQLNDLKDYIKQVALRHQVVVDVLTGVPQQEQGLKSILPFANPSKTKDGSYLGQPFYLPTDEVGNLIPFSYRNNINPAGLIYGINQITNIPIIIDRTDELNANGFVLGTSGSGKSVFTKLEIIAAIMKYTNDVFIIIDPENEYSSLATGKNGEKPPFDAEIIKLSPNTNTFINIFDTDLTYSEDGASAIQIKVDSVLTFCEVIKGSALTAKERSVINRCTKIIFKDFIASNGDRSKLPTLADFYKALIEQEEKEAADIALSLETYVIGSFNIFAHQTNIQYNKRVIIFDIFEMGNQLQTVGLMVLLEMIWQRVIQNKRNGIRTWVWTDEFSIMFNDNSNGIYRTGDFFEKVYKRIRKHGGVATGATQNISEVIKSKQAMTMLQNSEFLTMLAQKEDDLEIIKQMFRLSENQAKYLDIDEPGKGLIKCGKRIIPFSNLLPKDSLMYQICTTFISLLGDKYNPHAVLLDTDVTAIGTNIQAAVEEITQTYPYMRILVLTDEDDSYDYPVDCIVQGQFSNIKLKEILTSMASGNTFADTDSKEDPEEHLPHRIRLERDARPNPRNRRLRYRIPLFPRSNAPFRQAFLRYRLLSKGALTAAARGPIILAGTAAGVLVLVVIVLAVIKGVSGAGQVSTLDEAATTAPFFLFDTQPPTQATTEDYDYLTLPVEYDTTATVPTTVQPPTIAPEPTAAPRTVPPTTRSEEKPTAAPQTSSSPSSGGSSSGGSSSGGSSSSGGNNSGNSNGTSQNSQPATQTYGGEPVVSYDNNGRYSNSGGDAVSSVKLNYSSKTLEVDDAIQLSAAVSPSNANQSVSWSSSNSAVVSVNNGKITAKKVGKATITATAGNGKSASCEVTVRKKEQTDSVHLSASEYHISVGQTITVTLYGTSKVTWSVSNSNPVTFTSNKNEAKVKARRKGNTQLYAKDNATGKVYICDIYVG